MHPRVSVSAIKSPELCQGRTLQDYTTDGFGYYCMAMLLYIYMCTCLWLLLHVLICSVLPCSQLQPAGQGAAGQGSYLHRHTSSLILKMSQDAAVPPLPAVANLV